LLEDFDESPARSNDLAVIYTMLSVCHPPSFMNSTVSLGIKIGTTKKECKISTAIVQELLRQTITPISVMLQVTTLSLIN
jgi:hypothetical protein